MTNMKILKVIGFCYIFVIIMALLVQEFFQRQRRVDERNGVTVQRHQTKQTTGVSQDLMALNAAKHVYQHEHGII